MNQLSLSVIRLLLAIDAVNSYAQAKLFSIAATVNSEMLIHLWVS